MEHSVNVAILQQRNPIEKDVDALNFSIEDFSMSVRWPFDTKLPPGEVLNYPFTREKPFDATKPIGADLLSCQASQMRKVTRMKQTACSLGLLLDRSCF